MTASTTNIRSRLEEGTEALSDAARARVVAARQAAIDAHRATKRAAAQGADRVSDFYDAQPLVAGALAIAIGAAIAGALPRTRLENQYMGEQSDSLFDKAEQIFQEEAQKAKSVAQAALGEARSIVDETQSDLNNGAPDGQSAVEAVGSKLKSDANRVVQAAKNKADDKNLGKPKL